ncbi:MAG: bifunctional 2-polyprenyl-6-hydroxyphenol methylase/3-demethylubiquinol 3-O-methyltransferase UbiG [Caulobacteraceae bacterium]|nr:bifunctional 2-polyprenyl-6-hydroxyphenol methylase/3-demethylubiquinol 3-O-methyltransferase UbiG [Caulobacteraceae bacterium]
MAIGPSPSDALAIDADNVARFSALARDWWDPKGPFAALHALNPVRLAFIRDEALRRFGRDGGERRPFAGLRLLDVGCGGGLLCEPMTRLGFEVVGLDASAEGIGVARAHAAATGLAIDYRAETVEALAEERFDVVLAMEVVEHVPHPAAFLGECAARVAPGGLMVVATLNRTLGSLALGKIAAEYILRWAPIGAHDPNRFITPAEMRRWLETQGMEVEGPFGVAFDLRAGRWRQEGRGRVNYMMTGVKTTL